LSVHNTHSGCDNLLLRQLLEIKATQTLKGDSIIAACTELSKQGNEKYSFIMHVKTHTNQGMTRGARRGVNVAYLHPDFWLPVSNGQLLRRHVSSTLETN
jgi:hypothetical protein